MKVNCVISYSLSSIINHIIELEKFGKILLSVIIITLITGSLQFASADHLLGGVGIMKNEIHVNQVSTKDSKYEIHLQIVIRNAEGQLVSVTESTSGKNIPHPITDQIFDTEFGEEKIILLDKVTYEKKNDLGAFAPLEYPWRTSHNDMLSSWAMRFTANFPDHGLKTIPAFTVNTAHVYLEDDDTFTLKWTFLRELN